MDRPFLSTAALVALAAALTTPHPASAQKPQEPLGELLQVIPLPEPKEDERSEAESAVETRVAPNPAPDVPPGRIVPIQLPPSDAVEPDPVTETESPTTGTDAEAGVAVADAEPAPEEADKAELPAAESQADQDAANADAAWEAIQEQRREEINAVEAPVVEALNAEGAARAAAETQRIEEEMQAYRRSLVEAEEEARRLEAEHEAIMAEHARRVAREQAEHRARVEACLAGDREACGSPNP